MIDLGVGQALESLPNFAQGEVFPLEAADEAESGEMAFVVVRAGTAGFGRGKKALLDVIADGPRGDLGGVAELGEVEGAVGRQHEPIVSP